MFRKLLWLFAAIFFVSTLVACGDDAQSQTPITKSDLIGSWKGVDDSGKERFVTDISSDRIEIYWLLEHSSDAIYWVGTFPDSLVSVADQVAMENSLLASQSDTKEFKIVNGRLTFEASALGTTRTIHLQK